MYQIDTCTAPGARTQVQVQNLESSASTPEVKKGPGFRTPYAFAANIDKNLLRGVSQDLS